MKLSKGMKIALILALVSYLISSGNFRIALIIGGTAAVGDLLL